MLPGTLVKGFDKRRLRNLLLLFFLALALPTAVLIRQAYSQLKWEAFHQYRGQAEELTARIDARLIDMINIADARSFADYSFLVVTGDPAANFLQRSVLATYPVPRDIPGLLGYFQVDVSGTFSTPILPTAGSDRQKLGIDAGEYVNRQLLAQEIQKVLADNRLVRSRPERRLPIAPTDIAAAREAIAEEEKDVLAEVRVQSSAQQPAMAAVDFADSSQIGKVDANAYTQQVFDRLGTRQKDKSAEPSKAGAPDFDESPREDGTAQPATATAGKVSDIKLESAYQKKIEQLEKAVPDETAAYGDRFNAPARSRAPRKEQSTLPTSDAPSDDVRSVVAQSPDVRISTFESEIDPLEFSLLDSGHFVLFRKVWRDGERHIQGLVLDQAAFVEDVIVGSFMDTSLPLMSNLIVAYQDNVIIDARGRMNSYPNGWSRRQRTRLGNHHFDCCFCRRVHHLIPSGRQPDQPCTTATGLCVCSQSRAQDPVDLDQNVRRDVKGGLGRRRQTAELLRIHPRRVGASDETHFQCAATRQDHAKRTAI